MKSSSHTKEVLKREHLCGLGLQDRKRTGLIAALLPEKRWLPLFCPPGCAVLAALLFVMQGITGTRDLLEIPLSWQKPAVYACDFVLQRCS